MNRKSASAISLAVLLASCGEQSASPLSRQMQSVIANTTDTTPAPIPSPTVMPVSFISSDGFNDSMYTTTNPEVVELFIDTSNPSDSFSAKNLNSDFGTETFTWGVGFQFASVYNYKPRTVACNTSLGKLNTDFISFISLHFALLAFKGKVTITPVTGGVFATWLAAVRTLNADQADVNTNCKGQGAGMYPNG